MSLLHKLLKNIEVQLENHIKCENTHYTHISSAVEINTNRTVPPGRKHHNGLSITQTILFRSTPTHRESFNIVWQEGLLFQMRKHLPPP